MDGRVAVDRVMRRPYSPAAALMMPTGVEVTADTALAQLQRQTEHLAWAAYWRALRLQEAEPGPETLIIRNTVFDLWEGAFLALASA